MVGVERLGAAARGAILSAVRRVAAGRAPREAAALLPVVRRDAAERLDDRRDDLGAFDDEGVVVGALLGYDVASARRVVERAVALAARPSSCCNLACTTEHHTDSYTSPFLYLSFTNFRKFFNFTFFAAAADRRVRACN